MAIRLSFFFSALTLLAVVHSAALRFYLYWRFPWFDMPMHVLGGVCVALGYSILPFLRLRRGDKGETVWWYVGAAIVVGVLWEVFEYTAGISRAQDNFVIDTALDLIMDIGGGIIGYGVVRGTRTLLA